MPWIAEHSCRWGHPRPFVVNRILPLTGARDTLTDAQGRIRRFPSETAAARAASLANAKG